VSVEDVANVTGMSPRSLLRHSLRQETGMTAPEYLLRARLPFSA
jgi:transcriptional regulator GlxA family with amidase domain